MRLSDEAAHRIAAEYVVGTLRGSARRRFEMLARDDARVRAILARWEAGLTPLAERVSAVEPPARVWRAIQDRIRGQTPFAEKGSDPVSFWRRFGMIAAGLA